MAGGRARSRSSLHALLDAEATLDARSMLGTSNFQTGAAIGWDEMVQVILDSVAEEKQQAFVNELNPITGDTALMIACMFLESGMVEWLLSKMADPNIRCFDTDDHDFLVAPAWYFGSEKIPVELSAFNEGR